MCYTGVSSPALFSFAEPVAVTQGLIIGIMEEEKLEEGEAILVGCIFFSVLSDKSVLQ